VSKLGRQRRQGGFSLIELVMVIVIGGILAVTVAGFIVKPMEGYLDLTRRARLVDIAETALRRITREIRLAVPNSIRVDPSGRAIEILRMVDAGRYRAQPDALGGGDLLDFTANSDSFDTLGLLKNASLIDAGGSARSDCLAGTSDCLVIYNTAQPGANAYNGDNIASIQAATPTSITFNNSDVPAWRFPFASPTQRLYVADTPVSFICDTGAGVISRYDTYPIGSTQPSPSSPPAGAARRLADHVTGCVFSYSQGTASRGGIVTLRLTIADQGESVSLLLQSHVPNSP